ncbi:MAG: hypothetical protein N4A54_03880 [Peptostreptococcaceae bacterium]|jgi:nitrogen regulatory protein PII|nr:hypothetical protein [Peptostreptococcaceae bacterium]
MAKKGTNRKTYTTSIDVELIKKFRIYCAVKDLNQNEVLEKLISELLEKEESEGGEVGNSNK